MINFYNIDVNYIQYLRNFDQKIPNIQSSHYIYDKFFCGILLNVENNKFYAPISHNTTNFRSSFIIKDNHEKSISSVRLSFMIPSDDALLKLLDINKFPIKHQQLLYKELEYLRKNETSLLKKAKYIYEAVVQKKDNALVMSSCDFRILIEKAKLYKK